MVFIVGEQNSIANQFLAELRDKAIQLDRHRFRMNLERLGEIMAYEISKKLSYLPKEIQTPLGISIVPMLESKPVLIAILRAALPYLNGFQNFFNQSDVGFIGAFRKKKTGEVSIKLNYSAAPDLSGKTAIIIDPMLATGKSLLESVNELTSRGIPAHLHIAALVAAPEGIKYLQDNLRIPFTIWTFSVDEKLDHRFYIVPGLGDAGDLSYGSKM